MQRHKLGLDSSTGLELNVESGHPASLTPNSCPGIPRPGRTGGNYLLDYYFDRNGKTPPSLMRQSSYIVPVAGWFVNRRREALWRACWALLIRRRGG